MNKKFPVLVSIALSLAPLSAVAQMHGQMGAKSNVIMPGLLPGASLNNAGSVYMPLMPTTNLNGALVAPTPTVNVAVAAPGIALMPAGLPDGRGGRTDIATATRHSYNLVGYVPGNSPKIYFDGDSKKAAADVSSAKRTLRELIMAQTEGAKKIERLKRKIAEGTEAKKPASGKDLLIAISKNVDVGSGTALIRPYDVKTFNRKKSVAALDRKLSDWESRYETTVGADKVINMVRKLGPWLPNGDARHLATRLKQMQEAGLLKAVISRHFVGSTSYVSSTPYYYEIFTKDGHVLYLHFRMGPSGGA